MMGECRNWISGTADRIPLKHSLLRTDARSPDGLAPASFVRVTALRSFDKLVREHGADPAALLRFVQINPHILSQPSAVLPTRKLIRLLNSASLKLRCFDLGLRLAELQDELPRSSHPVAVAMTNAPTLREGLEFINEHMYAYSPNAKIDFKWIEDSGAEAVIYSLSGYNDDSKRQILECGIMRLYLQARAAFDGAPPVQEVWLEGDPLVPIERYRDHFGVEVRLNMPQTALLFEPGALDCAVVGKDSMMYTVARRYLDVRVQTDKLTMTSQVRTLLIEKCGQKVSCNTIAQKLNVSMRTLQRQLHEEGKSFQEIKDDSLREAARNYLRRDLPLSHIAERLGFAHQTAFSTTCKRWFGMPPTALRQKLRSVQP